MLIASDVLWTSMADHEYFTSPNISALPMTQGQGKRALQLGEPSRPMRRHKSAPERIPGLICRWSLSISQRCDAQPISLSVERTWPLARSYVPHLVNCQAI